MPLTAPVPTALLESHLLKWTVRFCALGAAILSGWLAWQKMNGQASSVAGCGGSDGCNQVLGGRWSEWLGVPVSFLAFGFYLAVLGLTLRPVQAWFGRSADRLLCAAAVMAILSGVWFVSLLAVMEKKFCPYCAAAHALGISFAIPLLVQSWRIRRQRSRGFFESAFSTAVPGFLILVGGQLFGPKPQTHLISENKLPRQEESISHRPALRSGEVAFFDGALVFDQTKLPKLGKDSTPHVLVEYFDYTCSSCRDMHADLEDLLKRAGNEFSVIVLPCPLSRECNPALPKTVDDHPSACLLARLALAVWRKAPGQFAEFHHYLMTIPLPADEAAAQSKAASICGGEMELNMALGDPWISEQLAETVSQFRLLSAQEQKMPKLLLRDDIVMHGVARDVESFRAEMKRRFPGESSL